MLLPLLPEVPELAVLLRSDDMLELVVPVLPIDPAFMLLLPVLREVSALATLLPLP